MKSIKRYYISNYGPKEKPVQEGFEWLIKLFRNDEIRTKALLAVPQKSNIDGVITSIIGVGNAKSLKKDGKVFINSKIELSLMTIRTSLSSFDGPVLAIYPTKKLLNCIDDMFNVTEILVIPWSMDEVQYWIDMWSVTELNNPNKPSIQKNQDDIVVETALDLLSHMVNISTGINHPLDKASAVNLFKILKNSGIKYDPVKIRANLISVHHWSTQNADAAMKVADDVLVGKRLKSGRNPWHSDLVDRIKKGEYK